MAPENFVSQIRSAVVEENTTIYKNIFASTTAETASDPYWKRALTLYQSLNEADREVLLEILRQVGVDTVSNLFSILDGTTPMEDPGEEFVVLSQPDNRKINGNLQDLFLEVEERERQ